jgi:two-component system chemotaxis sensor kinase CheA
VAQSGSDHSSPILADQQDEQSDLVAEFVTESLNGLYRCESHLFALEQGFAAADSIADMFRTIHTIKAASGFLAFREIESLSHSGEGLLSRLREDRPAVTSTIVVLLREMFACLRRLLTDVEAGGAEGSCNVTPLLQQLEAAQSQDEHSPEEMGPPHLVRNSKNFSVPEDSAKPIGRLFIEQARVSESAVETARELQRHGDLRTIGEILVSRGDITTTAAREIIEYQQEIRAANLGESSVLVEIGTLDRVYGLVAEVSSSIDTLAQHLRGSQDPKLTGELQRLVDLARSLHAESLRMRVKPLAVLLPRLNRLVQDLAQTTGKYVRLEASGEQVQIDKALLNAIKDPLMHLIRNAIDHGIEPPNARASAGKPAEGRILLSARPSADRLVLDISDDGAGINLEEVKRKALSERVIDATQADRMNDQEISSLIFLPGLTTARQITHTSGRGVGMEIVKTNIEKIGGSVQLYTCAGKGTTVRLILPNQIPSPTDTQLGS